MNDQEKADLAMHIPTCLDCKVEIEQNGMDQYDYMAIILLTIESVNDEKIKTPEDQRQKQEGLEKFKKRIQDECNYPTQKEKITVVGKILNFVKPVSVATRNKNRYK